MAAPYPYPGSNVPRANGGVGGAPSAVGRPTGFMGGAIGQQMPHQQQSPMVRQGGGQGGPIAGRTNAPGATGVPDGSASLWMGELEPWMDEQFVYNLFVHTGELLNVKIIRDRQTNQASGYGFIYLASNYAASQIMENFNGHSIPGTNKVFRLNWASHAQQGGAGGGAANTASPKNDQISVFVGDLAPDVTEAFLQQTFQYYYPSVTGAKIMKDLTTQASKGYGFVFFSDENERNRALSEMQGYQMSYRPIKVNIAQKKAHSQQQQMGNNMSSYRPPYSQGMTQGRQGGMQVPYQQQRQQQPQSHVDKLQANDPNNTTVFVGGLDPTINHDVLRAAFQHFGNITNVKIPFGKGCGFIEFGSRAEAENAINTLGQNALVGNCQVRISWGRPSAAREDPNDTKRSAVADIGLETKDDAPLQKKQKMTPDNNLNE